MEVNLADGINVDTQTIMTERGCAIGQSGSGKSFLAGVIAEELCKSKMPFCIIDTEGEYDSLKGMFNVIVVGGDNKDIDLDVDFSKLFNASIANGIPIILDLSDVVEKKEVAYGALEALYKLESKIRKPYLIFIEEADKFAPQVISKSANIVEEISVRGRKRGMGLFITTQRPANVSKNVLAQCSYGFIGKLTIENDLKALRVLFESRKTLTQITRLHTGEFVSFGLNDEREFKVKGRLVRHIGITPLIGSSRPFNNALASILKELKGEKQEARKEKGAQRMVRIQAIPISFTAEDAKAYAARIAKREFIVFGKITEKIEPIDLQYLPLGLCTMRAPTKHKNEYAEYHCIVNGRYELVRLEREVKFMTIGKDEDRSKAGYRKYFMQNAPVFDMMDVVKEDIISSGINKKRAKAHMDKVFPESVLVDFQIVYLPIYRITLRRGNKVRIFTIEGLYGQSVG